MIIFADHCVHTDVVEALIQNGIQVERVIERGLAKATDEEIFNYILKNSRILLTFDKDFGNIVRFDIKSSKGVVIAYIEAMSKKEIIDKVTDFFRRFDKEKLKNRLFIIEPKRIRTWPHAIS